MNSSPEIQFVILKNMGVILQICPDIKITSIQSFFVSYKDPLYLKFEKLNILISIADETNVSVLTAELQEYRKEVEPDFVKKSIHALGQLALKFPSAAEECLNILINASSADQEGLNQDTIVVLKDIYRKYGDKFSKYIPKIFENIGVIDRNDVIAAVIWLVGEYYGMISQSYKLLLEVTEYSESLDSAVHLQLLCTLAKLSMSGDAKIKNLFIRILDISMNKSQNPDIRTRAHMYSRLLSENTNLRESIILANKPQFQFNLDIIPKYMLNDLLKDIGSLFILSWDRIGYEPIARLKSYTHSR